MKILCLVVALPEELNFETLRSVLKQSVPVTEILILTKRMNAPTFMAKMSTIINSGLEKVKLEEYDYLLRVDADVVLPPNFLEVNLRGFPDVLGFGYAMLIKVKPFLKLMNGKLHRDSDDSYLIYNFMSNGLTFMRYQINPIENRAVHNHHGYKYFFNQGMLMYRFGYEPVHILANLQNALFLRNAGLLCFFYLMGYFKALLTNMVKFKFADYVFRKQTRKFQNPRLLLRFFGRTLKGLGHWAAKK